MSASAWGGGGRGTSASGVGTWAVSCSGLPQFGQTCSSGRSCCPQLLQYLCATTVIVPLLQNPKRSGQGAFIDPDVRLRDDAHQPVPFDDQDAV